MSAEKFKATISIEDMKDTSSIYAVWPFHKINIAFLLL